MSTAKSTTQSESRKQGLEGYDRTVRMLNELSERWNNRLTLDNLRLAERYVEGELCIILHARLANEECVAVFQRHLEIRQRKTAGYALSEEFVNPHGQVNGALRDGNEGCQQSMVLVGNVQFVDKPECVIFLPGTVWLRQLRLSQPATCRVLFACP